MNKNGGGSVSFPESRRAVLDTVPGLVLEVNRDLIVTLANKDVHRRWPFLREGSTTFHQLVQPLDLMPGECIVAETFVSRKNRSAELRCEEGVFLVKTNLTDAAPTGEILDILLQETLFEKKVVVLVQDITQDKLLEQQFEIVSHRYHDQLLQADKMISLGILASGMAHEINNPNNSIMLNVSVLHKAWNSIMPVLEEYYRDRGQLRVGGIDYQKMKKKMPSLFSGIQESSKKIQRIVLDLKHFSGKDGISMKKPVDMEAVVRSAISLTGNMISKSTRRFKAVYEKELPNVMGNFQNLEQVIINLVQNACQALDDPGQGVFITITRDEQDIVTAVKDEGIGIPVKDLKYIMEPFFTTKRSSGGTGLGLYMSSKIINQHGGSIRFVSGPDPERNPNRGTTVEVRLPVHNPSA